MYPLFAVFTSLSAYKDWAPSSGLAGEKIASWIARCQCEFASLIWSVTHNWNMLKMGFEKCEKWPTSKPVAICSLGKGTKIKEWCTLNIFEYLWISLNIFELYQLYQQLIHLAGDAWAALCGELWSPKEAACRRRARWVHYEVPKDGGHSLLLLYLALPGSTFWILLDPWYFGFEIADVWQLGIAFGQLAEVLGIGHLTMKSMNFRPRRAWSWDLEISQDLGAETLKAGDWVLCDL